MSDRIVLPNRRKMERIILVHTDDVGDSLRVFADMGFDPQNIIREIFIRPKGLKSGSKLERLYDDIGVSLSLNLQFGMTVSELGQKMGRLGSYPGTKLPERKEDGPASLIGAILEAAAKVEAEQ